MVLVAIGSSRALAEDTEQESNTAAAGEDTVIFDMVWYPSIDGECNPEVGQDEPGRAPDQPLRGISIVELIELVNEEGSKIQCSWVELDGYFRIADYYHYRGHLYDSAAEYYFSPSLVYVGSNSLWLEDFVDPTIRRTELITGDIRVVGQFYDLCREAYENEAAGDETSIMLFGPCHYGDAYMLRSVTLLSASNEPHRIIVGEQTRIIVGELVAPQENWPQQRAALDALWEWAALLREGREAYWTEYYRESWDDPYAGQVEEYFQRDIADDDSWEAYLTDPARSPLRNAGDDIFHHPARIFLPNDYEEESGRSYSILACACLTRDCEDRWPVFWEDAIETAGYTVCVELAPHGGDPGSWRWARR